MLLRTCAFVLLALALPNMANGQITDGFEGGAGSTVPGWNELGVAGVVDGSYGIPPFEGNFMAFVMSDPDYLFPGESPVADSTIESTVGLPSGILGVIGNSFGGSSFLWGSAIYRDFSVNAGDTVSFRYQHLHPDPGFSDFSFVGLQNNGVQVLADDFSSYSFVSTTLLYPFGTTVASTGWQPFNYVFPSSGTVRLAVGASNGTDNFIGPGLLIDDFQINGTVAPNQPPTCFVDDSNVVADFLQLGDGSWVITEGETFQLAFVGQDADGDILTSSASGVPSGASVFNTSGPQPLMTGFSWTPIAADEPGAPYTVSVSFTDPSGATSGTCSITISDINLNPSCSITGETSPGLTTVECQSPSGATVQLGVSASDPDGDTLEYLWNVSDASVVLDDDASATPTGNFPFGDTMATVVVTDGRGGVAICDTTIRVQDTVPPEVSCTTDVAALWPANHKMVNVQVMVVVDDMCTDPSLIQLSAVTVSSDESDDHKGDGQTVGDVNGSDGFAAPVDVAPSLAFDSGSNMFVGTIALRAERDGSQDGRKYTLDVTAVDSSGNQTTTSCCVVVPHDQRVKSTN